MPKPVIRIGSPFSPSTIESVILDGMKGTANLHRDEEKFYAGDVVYCPRRAVKFLVTDRTASVAPSSHVYMKMGISIHGLITDAMHKSGALIFKEFRLPPSEKPDIRGIVDAIFFAPGNKIMGMEIKSCGKLPAAPKEDHVAQAIIYSAITGLEFVMTYISRNVAGWDGKLMLKSFELECTERDMHQSLTKACLAHFAKQMGVLPPIPTGFTIDSCGFCPFKDECWEEGGEPGLLPEATPAQIEELYELAEPRAKEILEGRGPRRNGIMKHIYRYASPAVQKKLDDVLGDSL